jgi:hypothetical protein
MTSRSHAAAEIPEPSNPLGLDGIEFIEYATSQHAGSSVRSALNKSLATTRRRPPIRTAHHPPAGTLRLNVDERCSTLRSLSIHRPGSPAVFDDVNAFTLSEYARKDPVEDALVPGNDYDVAR